MRKMNSKKGFTLAELLVVVAIIAVLVAIAIPVFGASQKKAKLAVDHAAVRDAYAIVQIANNLEEVEIDGVSYTFEQIESLGMNKLYFLSEDCSYLINSYPLVSTPYMFKETGDDGSGKCPDCKLWDESLTGSYQPISSMHTKDGYIYVTFLNGKLHLGIYNG